MRPQGHSQGQATNRVTRPLPRFITKTPILRVRPIGWESDAHSMRSSYFIDEGIDVSLVTYLKPGAAA